MTDDDAGYAPGQTQHVYYGNELPKFDLPKGITGPQSYVHRCHIVEHEDNEMMRPFTVIP